MLIIGCDFHSRFQQIAMADTETGELIERRLEHRNGEAAKFTPACKSRCEWAWRRPDTRNGSSGSSTSWDTSFWIGDAAAVRAPWCASRKLTREMRGIFSIFYSRTDSHDSEFPHLWSVICESRCGIATKWFVYEPR
jgi:hypothetical protein